MRIPSAISGILMATGAAAVEPALPAPSTTAAAMIERFLPVAADRIMAMAEDFRIEQAVIERGLLGERPGSASTASLREVQGIAEAWVSPIHQGSEPDPAGATQAALAIGWVMRQHSLGLGLPPEGVVQQLRRRPAGATSGIAPENSQRLLSELVDGMADERRARNQEWLDARARLPGVEVTASGLQIERLAPVAAGVAPTTASTVRVRYRGWLPQGVEFDRSGDEPTEFQVIQLIPGWTETLLLMKPGETCRITCPPRLAYDDSGSPPLIGPAQILQFELTLMEILP